MVLELNLIELEIQATISQIAVRNLLHITIQTTIQTEILDVL